MTDQDWRADATCRIERVSPSVFFPLDGDYREAARVCERCPVTRECREAGKDEQGWWGGTLSGRETVALLASSASRCRHCGQPVTTSGLRRPGGRWCNLACYRATEGA